MKPGFFVKEALRSIRRNPIPSFAAMASMLVTLLVLGVFIPMVQATTGAANTVRGPGSKASLPVEAPGTPSLMPGGTLPSRLNLSRPTPK